MWILLGLSCSNPSGNNRALPKYPSISLQINAVDITVGYASLPHETSLGLRYRDLGPDDGLLMKVSKGQFSMEEMKQPLSIALISSDGTIENFWDMDINSEPNQLPEETAFLLEMTLGWFVRHDIIKDMKVIGLPENNE